MFKFLLLLFFLLPDGGAAYLTKIPLFQKDSYFKQQVYSEHSWKCYYALKETRAIVQPDNYDLHLMNVAFFFVTTKLREEKNSGL